MDSTVEQNEIEKFGNSITDFDEWIELNYQPLNRMAEAIVRRKTGTDNLELADDITIHAVAIVFEQIESGKLGKAATKTKSMRNWIYGIMRMLIFESHKNHTRMPNLSPEYIDRRTVESLEERFDAIMDSQAIATKIQECLSMLSPSEREVWGIVVTMGGERPPSKEIANTLGTSEGAVNVHYKAGRDKLSDCLKFKGIDHE